ncbi:heavy metal translocating P-type ATPase [Anaerotignum sp. MB30-C6]|uniref:heavy metal translocating P-type ATPase n=1 Tax=Anaerotignum sp. MB30-C6 TaxID=3070814 RepID=UPI0027DCBE5A|nr:heavy metal translocating P-type ATPase [Anaerotignum sp. MB30-C6]WMI79798.1 heavy metal translocating P-type ATPase [Anaerotignum sp. MB30-C6]
MNFKIQHEMKGRIRVHLMQNIMTFQQADLLQYYLRSFHNIKETKIYVRTCGIVISYNGNRKSVLDALKQFQYSKFQSPSTAIEDSGRKLTVKYQERLVQKTIIHFGAKIFLPYQLRALWISLRAARFIYKGLCSIAKKQLDVNVLDATAIGVSIFRGEFKTASSIMFLLGIGETMEEWTHKKSVGDLARSMSLNTSKVCLIKDGQEILVNTTDIQPGEQVIVRMGTVIPFDGNVISGEALINQASLTGEALPVKKECGGYVYAGTVVEEGEITLNVKAVSGATRYEKIVKMIEESEKLKSKVESKAEHLADRLVPYTLLGTAVVWVLTRNVTKALSVLMVDFSCALKLAMPISVLSAIREASKYKITIKGGKYLEAIADATTIVFDKTGTLTKAKPTVKAVIPFGESSADEMLRIAACLEEHFPHSMAKAVVHAAKKKGLDHNEMHSKVEYIVAHGIVSSIDNKKVVIGSHHFVFEDEGSTIDESNQEKFDALSAEYTHLYLAIENKLVAVICIEDPLREEAPDVIKSLRKLGINKVVMMTGDSERTAAAVAKIVEVDEYYSEVLPEDKANFIEKEKQSGNRVIMIGDGINDSPALSAADVGIAIRDGAEIAKEISDVTIAANDLSELVTLKRLSNHLMKRIQNNYAAIVGINAYLIVLGVGGAIRPTTSALLHNTSTLMISLKDMQNLLPHS